MGKRSFPEGQAPARQKQDAVQMLGCKGRTPLSRWGELAEASCTLETSEVEGFQEREGGCNHTYASDLGVHPWNVEPRD